MVLHNNNNSRCCYNMNPVKNTQYYYNVKCLYIILIIIIVMLHIDHDVNTNGSVHGMVVVALSSSSTTKQTTTATTTTVRKSMIFDHNNDNNETIAATRQQQQQQQYTIKQNDNNRFIDKNKKNLIDTITTNRRRTKSTTMKKMTMNENNNTSRTNTNNDPIMPMSSSTATTMKTQMEQFNFKDNDQPMIKALKDRIRSLQRDDNNIDFEKNASTILTNSDNVPSPSPLIITTTTPTLYSNPMNTMTYGPTYIDKCYVCNNDSKQYIKYPNNTVYYVGEIFQCNHLELAGRIGYIPSSSDSTSSGTALCTLAQNAISNSNCGCHTNSTNTSGLNSTDNDIDNIPTSSPSITYTPTITMSPTYTEICYLCGNENIYIDNPIKELMIFNELTNCNTLDIYSRTIGFPKDICNIISQQSYQICGCSKTIPPTPIITASPTISYIPTITSQPSYQIKCNICNHNNNDTNEYILDPSKSYNETLIIRSKKYNCNTLQDAALSGLINSESCTIIQNANVDAIQLRSTTSTRNSNSNNINNGCTCIPPITSTTDGIPSSSYAITITRTIIATMVTTALLITTIMTMIIME